MRCVIDSTPAIELLKQQKASYEYYIAKGDGSFTDKDEANASTMAAVSQMASDPVAYRDFMLDQHAKIVEALAGLVSAV